MSVYWVKFSLKFYFFGIKITKNEITFKKLPVVEIDDLSQQCLTEHICTNSE